MPYPKHLIMKPFLTLTAFLLFSVLLAAQNDICQIDLGPGTRAAAFANGENVTLDFEYSTDQTAGVRIFARPFTNGNLTPSYAASGSPLYTGSGNGSASFTISTGTVKVDEIRFQILTADQSMLLREFFIPVAYDFGENGVHSLTFSTPAAVGSFLHNEQVDIDFSYHINHPGGVRIFVRPFTNGNLSPGYGASGSPIFTGTGNHMVNFSINSGTNVRVDSLRVQVSNADQTQVLETFFVPVNWYWSNVKITNFTLAGNNFPANGENRTVSFNYQTTVGPGVRIFPRPFSNGDLTPGYGACGSPVFTGSGSDDCSFTISGSNQHVDHIRFMATNDNQTQTLLEMYYPVDLVFGNFLVQNLVTCPTSPARLTFNEHVNSYYGTNNREGASGRIFVRPFTAGNLSAGYAASGSPEYGAGVGNGSDFFTITSGGLVVDQLRFQITNNSQTTTWGNYFYPVHYVFGNAPVTSTHTPAAQDFLTWRLGPNPVRDQATLHLQSLQQQDLQLVLVDALGRLVKQWPTLNLHPGQMQDIVIDTRELGLPGGMYFLHLRGTGFLATEALVVTR